MMIDDNGPIICEGAGQGADYNLCGRWTRHRL